MLSLCLGKILLQSSSALSSLGLEDVSLGWGNIRSLMYAYGYLWLQNHQTTKSIKDIVECAIPNTSTVIRNSNISDQRTRAASAAIVSATSTVLSDEKFKRKELLSQIQTSQLYLCHCVSLVYRPTKHITTLNMSLQHNQMKFKRRVMCILNYSQWKTYQTFRMNTLKQKCLWSHIHQTLFKIYDIKYAIFFVWFYKQGVLCQAFKTITL